MTPQEAYFKCLEDNKRDEQAEKIIINDSGYATYYAKDVIKGRWIEAEKIIIKEFEFNRNSENFWMYLRDVVKTRWPEAEDAILKHGAAWVYRYAKDINDGKVPKDMLNKMLIKDNNDVLYTCKYAIQTINGKLPENLNNQIIALFTDHPDNKYIKAYLEFIETNSLKAWNAC